MVIYSQLNQVRASMYTVTQPSPGIITLNPEYMLKTLAAHAAFNSH